MKARRLGSSGISVSAIGFGGWGIGGNGHGNSYGPTDDQESLRAIRRALDLGCTFFDTADVYGWGHSEALLGQALAGRRDEVVLATKVGGDFYHGGVRLNFSPEYIRFALTKSLERLRTDAVDLYQLHNPPESVVRDPATRRVLEELKDEGKIRAYGVSIHDPSEGLVAMESGRFASVQVVYNLVHRAPESELLPACRAKGVGAIAREPLWNAFLTAKFKGTERFESGDIRAQWPASYRQQRVRLVRELQERLARDGRTLAQAALAFVVSRSDVSTVIPGCKSVQQVEENMAAADIPWTAEDEESLDELIPAA
jgi:aryl-alcohol dehydrogenase-like predicted oxidoreductase